MILADLATPCLLIEDRRLEANLAAMQERAEALGARLRPHVKTHKAPALAERQQALGAEALTVATPGEASAFAKAGFRDLRVAYAVVGEHRHARLAELMEAGVRLSFCVDTLEGAEQAAHCYAARGLAPEVLVEVDTGHGRTGVPYDAPEEAVALARAVRDAEGLQLAGLLTHAGHAYRGPEPGETPAEALRRKGREEAERLLAVAVALHEMGLAEPEDFELSIGSTPSLRYAERHERGGFRITEIRPGNYVFHDNQQVALGSATLHDCALTAWTTVVSKRRHRGRERLYLDAGKKVLTTDQGYGVDGYGTLLYNAQTMTPLPHARITGLSEEHAWVEVPGGSTLEVGDRVRLVPNHACVTVATQRQLYLVDRQDVVGVVDVRA